MNRVQVVSRIQKLEAQRSMKNLFMMMTGVITEGKPNLDSLKEDTVIKESPLDMDGLRNARDCKQHFNLLVFLTVYNYTIDFGVFFFPWQIRQWILGLMQLYLFKKFLELM